ncbi:DUF4097 family beta strand repeat-containing protein [Actinokineospora enzanensis]|uniref:DUF4097 family beta strand repeat-containing protein n=1 Tax=Actinokineospora enzanensis TaxID=155975 RepID=UPI0003806CC7|nr:DUF4097 family beta strand repeat-containing protein [Actinokineospora enzanensis]
MSDVRMEQFATGGDPVEVTIALGAGRVDVRLTDEEGVDVEVRHSPEDASPWADPLNNLMSWFTNQFGEETTTDVTAEAVQRTRVELIGGRLVVRTPKEAQLRSIPMAVTVRAPLGSSVSVRSGAGSVRVTGVADRVDVTTGGGTIDIAEATGPVQATSGTGAVRVGPAPAGAQVRTGRGEIELAALGGSSMVLTGGGDVWLGAVTGSVNVRSGTGNITVADAASGDVQLKTGSGALRIGIRPGSPAEIDVSSGSADVRSELPLRGTAPEQAPPLRVRARTGLGSALVTLATTTAR